MALVIEPATQSLQQQNSIRRERRVGRQHDDQLTFEEQPHNGQPEVVSGHLVMLATRQKWPVFARLYKTSAGHMLVLWPDKLHAAPIGCATLKDLTVLTDEDKLTFTLATHDDALPLTLRADDRETFLRWTSALTGSDRKRRKFTSDVIRLPMLVEEEP